MKQTSQKDTVNSNMSFEDALKELQEVVTNLESGQVGLSESVILFQRGVALKTFCEEKINSIKEFVETIDVNENKDEKNA